MPAEPSPQGLQRLRLVGLSVLSFLLMLSYSIVRPSTESLFIEAHSSTALPRVWIAVALVMALTVWVYNRFVGRVELLRLYGLSSLVSAVLLAMLIGLREMQMPLVSYAMYVHKDVYMVVLVEVFYSYGNTVFPIRQARWAYGLFGFVGALGGLMGGLLIGPVAGVFGTASSLWGGVLLMVVMAALCFPLSKKAGAFRLAQSSAAQPSAAQAGPIDVIRRSNYLVLVLILIGLVQITITLVDYQFNTLVEQAYPLTDERTGVVGRVYAAVNLGTILLHSMTGPVLRAAGVPAVLLGIPLVMAAGLATFAAAPRFAVMAGLKVASKVFDYTWFRAAKEILYIPLSYDEKTAGKSVVDMLTYRVSKAAASIVLMGLIAAGLAGWTGWVTGALVVAWLAVTVGITTRFRSRVSREAEMR